MDALLSPAQVAELIPFNADWIRGQCRTGQINAIKVGGRWLMTLDDVETFLERHRVAPPRTRYRRQRLITSEEDYARLSARQRRNVY